MSTHSSPSPTTNTSAVRNTVGRGKEKSQENPNEPASNAALKEFCDKNYNQRPHSTPSRGHQAEEGISGRESDQKMPAACPEALNQDATDPDHLEENIRKERRCLEDWKKSSCSRGTKLAPKRHHDRKAYLHKGGRMSESEDSAGGHWKSKSKKQRLSVEDEDLSQP
ncbi:hypothetical protein Tco_0510699 [Tanacetum coccineum]